MKFNTKHLTVKFVSISMVLSVTAVGSETAASKVDADRQSATAIVFSMTNEVVSSRAVDRIESEIKAIKALKINGTEKLQFTKTLPDALQIEPVVEIQKQIIENIKKSVALEEGYSSFSVKKTGIASLDNLLLSYPVASISESVQVSADANEPSIVIFELKFDRSQFSSIDFVTLNDQLHQIQQIKDAKFRVEAHYGRMTIGTNHPGIQRLESEQGEARYVLWQAVGDCMAGCRGRYFYFTVKQEGAKFVAHQINEPNEQVSVWGIPKLISGYTFDHFADIVTYSTSPIWWKRLNAVSALGGLLSNSGTQAMLSELRAHRQEATELLNNAATTDADQRVKEAAEKSLQLTASFRW